MNLIRVANPSLDQSGMRTIGGLRILTLEGDYFPLFKEGTFNLTLELFTPTLTPLVEGFTLSYPGAFDFGVFGLPAIIFIFNND